MIPPEQRAGDWPSYHAMKTPGPFSVASPHGLTQSRSGSQMYGSSTATAISPAPSPRHPPSASPLHPPRFSPGITRGDAQGAQTPSPNYFGLAVDPTGDPRDSSQLPRENWSSPSSSVKSFGAVLPTQLPLDANPEFEAFRRQVDANRARAGFSLSTSHFNIATGGAHTPPASTPSALQRPRPPKRHTQGGDGLDPPFPRSSRLFLSESSGSTDVPGGSAVRDADGLPEDSAYVSAESKRSSAVSLNPPAVPSTTGRREISPPKFQLQFPPMNRAERGHSTTGPAHGGRPSPQGLPRTGSQSPSLPISPQEPLANGPSMISPAGLRELLETGQESDLLLLDLRVTPHFVQSRIRGALNLCIPTTLLKRATFNLHKLQQTFQTEEDEEKFAAWPDATHLVVYDASSSDGRDAVSSVNMIKKFTNEGYSGHASILRGGFKAFAAAYPGLVDHSSSGSVPGLSLPGARSVSGDLRTGLPPVFGGVMLPSTNDNPSPFFNNIRQNQDLVDGVGQMAVGVPSGLTGPSLPRWLREAAEAADRGKRVSDKFLRIELAEQSRMREAYSVVKPTAAGQTTQEERTSRVQLSGIEKGGKNRYKDILPFEHARVRLRDRSEGACDYVNASHLRAKRTYKRYIASQGPLPATFEDFWSVVWDNDVRIVVMLTAESEGGQLKCHPYWKGREFGPMRLRVLSEKKVSLEMDRHCGSPPDTAVNGSTQSSSASDGPLQEGSRRRAHTTTTLGSNAQMPNQSYFASQTGTSTAEPPYVIIRKFALSHAEHPFSPMREITQLHYPSWPDFGAPAQPSHLLALVELANVMQRAALPLDMPTTLHSASVSRQTSDVSAEEAGNQSVAGCRAADHSSPPALRKAESIRMSAGWHDAPEPSGHARPMLVHCSAGCGRTGAFCTVDSVIDMLKRQRQHMLKSSGNENSNQAQGNGSPLSDCDSDGDVVMEGGEVTGGGPGTAATTRFDDIHVPRDDSSDIDTSWLDDDGIDLVAQTVEEFRGQRLSMVQSLRQFVLCYETVLEWLRRLQESGGGGIDVRGRMRSGSLAF